MSLSSLHLDAFLAVARTLSFSKAAASLHVTQSALSQRIKNLETEMALPLFLRSPQVRLTPSGEVLLKFCRTRQALEEEFLGGLKSTRTGELAGTLRLGAYSSVMRSVVMPALAPLLRAHPKVIFELSSREMTDLPGMLSRGEADFIVMDRRLERAGVEAVPLGREEYVAIESAEFPGREDLYLDHDPDDTATFEFFGRGTYRSLRYRRAFLDDVYGVLDGVAHGLGRAVMPRHLIDGDKRFRILKGHRPRSVEVFLLYDAQPFYPRLHQAVVAELEGKCQAFF